jgi:hypothetical protein
MPKSKWTLGIEPRHFCWIIKDHLAICERPGGFGENHRKVRREEEIQWIRNQGFTMVVSLLSSTHNLHAYDEFGLSYMHVPFHPGVENDVLTQQFFEKLSESLAKGERIIMHEDNVSDFLIGIVAAFLYWGQFFNDATEAITFTERLVGRQIGADGRMIVKGVERLAPPTSPVKLPSRKKYV